MRIRQQEAIRKLNQNDQYEDIKFKNDDKRNPYENLKKRNEFVKNYADLVNEHNNIKKPPREEVSFIESFKGKQKEGPKAWFKGHVNQEVMQNQKPGGSQIHNVFTTPIDLEF